MSEPPVNILLVEDNPADARFIRAMLDESGESAFRIVWTDSLEAAFGKLDQADCDLVILDLSLPDSAGFETFERLHQRAPKLPIVVVSGLSEKQTAIRAVQEGAQDYLVKDQYNSQLLVRSLRYAIERNRLRRSLQDSEARFRQLTENMREVFWLYQIEARQLIYVSTAFEKVWGRPSRDFFENYSSLAETIHADDRERVAAAFHDQAALGQYAEEYRIVRPDGTVRWIRDRAVPIVDGTGAVYRIAGIAEDITPRKELERQVLEIGARQQQQISSDLHDSVGQQLVGLSYLAKSLARKLTERELPERETAQQIVDATQRAIVEVRRAIRGLTPVEVDAQGLMVALEQLAADAQQRFDIPCRFAYDQPVLVENNATATHLFRIAQEAITNAVKYAAPSAIAVNLKTENGRVSLTISDDGVGFGNLAEETGGFGMRIMRYRAGVIGARLQIESSPDGGTIVCCMLEQSNTRH